MSLSRYHNGLLLNSIRVYQLIKSYFYRGLGGRYRACTHGARQGGCGVIQVPRAWCRLRHGSDAEEAEEGSSHDVFGFLWCYVYGVYSVEFVSLLWLLVCAGGAMDSVGRGKKVIFIL